MGYEFIIELPDRDRSRLDQVLRRLPHFHGFNLEYSIYEFRIPENTGEMPSAVVVLEQDGVYFCDNGDAQSLLDTLLGELRGIYGDVRAREL